MTSQPPAADESPLFQSPELFQQPAPKVGRPPSSTSTSETSAPDSPPSPLPPPVESSTSQAPSSSTEPRPAEAPTAPAPEPSGASPSEPTSLRARLEQGITSATETAYHTLTDDVGRAHKLYLATEHEVTAVADGAASIVQRRIPAAAGTSEMADILQVALAVTSYATRTWKSWKAARAHRAALQAQTEQQTATA